MPQGEGKAVHKDVTYELDQFPEDNTEEALEKTLCSAIRGHMKDLLSNIATRGPAVADIERAASPAHPAILATFPCNSGARLAWDARQKGKWSVTKKPIAPAPSLPRPWVHPDPATVSRVTRSSRPRSRKPGRGLARAAFPSAPCWCWRADHGRGHNQRVQRGSVIHHAEMNCLENAGRQRHGYQPLHDLLDLSPVRCAAGDPALRHSAAWWWGERHVPGAGGISARAGRASGGGQNAECIQMMREFIAAARTVERRHRGIRLWSGGDLSFVLPTSRRANAAQSQRDCVLQPRDARTSYPGLCCGTLWIQ